jgi:hypothetical protein
MSKWSDWDASEGRAPEDREAGGLPPRATPPGFVLVLAALGTLGGLIAIGFLAADGLVAHGRPSGMKYAALYFFADMVLAGLIAGFVYVASRRGRTPARWTFFTVLVLGFLGQVVSALNYERDVARNNAALDEVLTEAEAAAAEMGSAAASPTAALDRMLAALDKTSNTTRGEMAMVAQAQARFFRELRVFTREYEDAARAWRDALALALTEREDVVSRLRVLDRVDAATRAMAVAMAAAPERMGGLLEKAGVGHLTRRELVQSMHDSAPLHRDVSRQRLAFCELERQLFEMLRDNAAGWHHDEQGSGLVFDDSELKREVESLLIREDELGRAVARAELQLKEHAQSLVRATTK